MILALNACLEREATATTGLPASIVQAISPSVEERHMVAFVPKGRRRPPTFISFGSATALMILGVALWLAFRIEQHQQQQQHHPEDRPPSSSDRRRESNHDNNHLLQPDHRTPPVAQQLETQEVVSEHVLSHSDDDGENVQASGSDSDPEGAASAEEALEEQAAAKATHVGAASADDGGDETNASLLQEASDDHHHHGSVLVLGGGLSGLAAAVTLLQQHAQQAQRGKDDNNNKDAGTAPLHLQAVPKVTLLESSADRLGGRVWTVPFPTSGTNAVHDEEGESDNDETRTISSATIIPIDLGGMYWHGGLDVPVLRDWMEAYHPNSAGNDGSILVATGGTSAHPAQAQAVWKIRQQSDGDNKVENDNNNRWRDLTAAEIQRGHDVWQQWNEFVNSKVRAFVEKRENEDTGRSERAIQQEMKSWQNEFEATLAVANAENDPEDTILDRTLFAFHLRMQYGLDLGLDFHRTDPHCSLRNWDWKNMGTTDTVMAQGMQSVVDALAQTVRSSPAASILLRQRVVRIEAIPSMFDSGQIAPHSSFFDCRIETAEGLNLTADFCIVTLPLGVLKAKQDSLFDPPLPLAKREALRRTGVGTLNTVAVRWNRPVCKDGFAGVTEDDGATSAYYLLDPTAVTVKDATTNVADTIKMEHDNEQGNKKRNQNPLGHGFICSGMLRGLDQVDPSITQFYLHDTEGLDFDNETYWREQAWEVVQSLVNEKRENATPLQILDIQISKWHADLDFLGSYSAPTTSTRGNDDRRILAEPYRDVWFFAGEHTHYEGRFQSLDGAYETGVRAARQVQDALRRRPKKSSRQRVEPSIQR